MAQKITNKEKAELAGLLRAWQLNNGLSPVEKERMELLWQLDAEQDFESYHKKSGADKAKTIAMLKAKALAELWG